MIDFFRFLFCIIRFGFLFGSGFFIKMNDNILDSVFPIIYFDNKLHANIEGTSILTEYKNSVYLVTAKHVLNGVGKTKPLYILLKDKKIELNFEGITSKILNGIDLDIAFFKISDKPDLMNYFYGYKTISLLEFNENIEFEKEHFYILGFPYRKAKHFKKTNTFYIKPIRYITNKIDNDLTYSKYNKNKDSHIIVSYDVKKTINYEQFKTKPPYLHGASGGILLRILIDKQDKIILYIFEGILIEWREKKFVVCTKKSKLRDLIDKDSKLNNFQNLLLKRCYAIVPLF